MREVQDLEHTCMKLQRNHVIFRRVLNSVLCPKQARKQSAE